MTLKEAMKYGMHALLCYPMSKDDEEAAALLRRAIQFVEAAEEHFAGERNYASVVDAYRAWRAAK